MKFSQMLRGIAPPPPPLGVGRVHRLENKATGISEELLVSRHEASARQVLTSCGYMLEAVKLGAKSYREISDKSGVNITTVKQRIPMLIALGKVSVITNGKGTPADTSVINDDLTIDEVFQYLRQTWSES